MADLRTDGYLLGMSMRIDPDGINLGWFAVDRDGHLGFFKSQGSRVVPESVLASRETWEFLNKAIQSLPRIGKGSPPWYRYVDGKLKHWIAWMRKPAVSSAC